MKKDALLECLLEFQSKLFREGMELTELTLSKQSVEELEAEDGIQFNSVHTPYGLIRIHQDDK